MNWKYFDPKFEYEQKFEDSAWPWSGHKYFAYDLIANIKPKKIVELGTHYGTSLWSFSQAVKDNQIDTEINAVDTWKGEAHAGIYGEEVFETVNDIKNKFYSDLKINLIRKTFDEALSYFEDNSVDILHIDGLHTYEAVKHDFEIWLPKVKQDGIIILHDIRVREDDFGVYKLWEELKEKYSTIEFFQSFGLGVLFLDKGLSEEFKNKEKEWQMHYSYIHEMKKIESIHLKDHIIRSEYQKVKEKNQKAENLNQPFPQKDQEIINLNQIVYVKNQEIKIKNQEKQQYEKKIEQLNKLLQGKEQLIEFIQSSKFWKLRKWNEKIKYLLLHPILFLNKYRKHKFLKSQADSIKNAFLARDRSRDKKVMLFMDYTVPTYNKDAGSFIVFEYLKIFKNMGYKIIFWPHNLEKMEPYTVDLQKLDIEVAYGNLSFLDFIKGNGKYIELAVISRPHVANTYMDDIRRYSDAKIIHLPLDLHYLREIREADLAKNPEMKKNALKTKSMECTVMKKADSTLFFSKEEVRIVLEEFPEISADFIPWIQNPNTFNVFKNFSERSGILLLGGFAHHPNIDAAHWLHDEILPELKKLNSNAHITIIGSNPPTDIIALDSEDFKILGFIEDINPYLNQSMVLVAPLRFGAGFKGKIALAMSCGLPVVTTTIGAEGNELQDGNNAFITDDPKQFANKIYTLCSNEDIWNNISKKSVEHVASSYSIANAKEIFNKILEKI